MQKGTALLTPELLAAVGYQTDPVEINIDQTLLERFATGIGRGVDEITTPIMSSLYFAVLMRGAPVWDAIKDMLPAGAVDAGGEYEIHATPAIGDVITVVNTFSGVTEKVGSRGPMLLCEITTVWTRGNQRMASARARAMFY